MLACRPSAYPDSRCCVDGAAPTTPQIGGSAVPAARHWHRRARAAVSPTTPARRSVAAVVSRWWRAERRRLRPSGGRSRSCSSIWSGSPALTAEIGAEETQALLEVFFAYRRRHRRALWRQRRQAHRRLRHGAVRGADGARRRRGPRGPRVARDARCHAGPVGPSRPRAAGAWRDRRGRRGRRRRRRGTPRLHRDRRHGEPGRAARRPRRRRRDPGIRRGAVRPRRPGAVGGGRRYGAARAWRDRSASTGCSSLAEACRPGGRAAGRPRGRTRPARRASSPGSASSGEGGLVVLRADAGVGKTRLVRELERLAPVHGVAAHSALVLDFGAGEGRDVLAMLARQAAGGRAAPRGCGGASCRDASRSSRSCSALLGLPLTGEARRVVDATPVEERRRRLPGSLPGLGARERPTRRPLLLVVEDVHWADERHAWASWPPSARRAGRIRPCCSLLTTRREGDPIDAAWLAEAGSPPTTVIDLRPLREADAQKLAGLLLAGCRDEAVERCVARAQGNPLFLEQLARHLRERLDDAVPVSVQTLIQARLDRLEAAHREALRAASVLGQRFTLAALRAVLGQPAYDPAPLVQRLFVRLVPEGYLFAHALIRDAVYDLLLRSQRRELHQRAAAFFKGQDAALHAQHLDRANDPGRSARPTRRRHGNRRTPTATRRPPNSHCEALSLPATPADRFALACLCGHLQLDLGRAAEGQAGLRHSLRLCRQRGRAVSSPARACRGNATVRPPRRSLDSSR